MFRSANCALRVAAVAVGLVLAQPGNAAVITYSEPPDLGNNGLSATDIGVLGIGLNTVTGNIACSGSICAQGDRSDFFTMTLPESLRITKITVALSNVVGVDISFNRPASFVGRLLDSRAAPGSSPFLPGGLGFTVADLPETTVFSGAVDGVGTVGFVFQATPSGATRLVREFDYVMGITVEAIPTLPVPEPASLALFGAGLLGLAATRRRARIA